MTRHAGFVTICIVLMLLEGLAHAVEKEDPTAALVNGKSIPMSHLDREIRKVLAIKPELQFMENMAVLGELRKQALQYLIDRELIIQEGEKAGLKIQKEEVDAELTKVKEEFPSQEVFEQALKQQMVTEETFRGLIGRELTIRKVQELKIKPLAKPVTKEDVAVFYETYKEKFIEPEKANARHILIKVSPETSEQEKAEAKSKIQAILEEAKAGADFAELAEKHSQCPSASRGGDLGYFARGDMVEPFGETAFGMEPGQLSDVVETQFGYHIILLVDKQPEKQIKLEDVSKQIEGFLVEREMDTAFETWLKPIRENATIEILLTQQEQSKQ